ncbi:PEP-CTERM sorting domain-containing protein [Candidatus Gracilibacteria bacterium]|nr:PEP-CTERM sorting domain-containing protein [Candidatus Gracilibacteria bacterium]
MGALTALGFGIALKRKLARKSGTYNINSQFINTCPKWYRSQ